MKQITLKSLAIANFKGIKSLNVQFSQHETSINGDNGLGKTSVFDAFLWLLFGKDSFDRKDFGVKPKGSEKVEVDVTGVFDIDGNETTLRRVLTEKWQKKRGSETSEFTGNETKFFWNEVPFSATEYQTAIKVQIDEGLFKLLTNVEAFNSLPWQERRQILFNIVGVGSDADIAETITDKEIASFVISILSQQKTLKQYKAELAEKKKSIKSELEQINPRVDEANRAKPIINESRAELENLLQEQKERYNAVQLDIESESKRIDEAHAEVRRQKNELQEQINAKEIAIQKLEHELKQKANTDVFAHNEKVQALELEIRQIAREIESKQHLIRENQKEIERIESILVAYRTEYDNLSALEFKHEQKDGSCPTCKQALPLEVVDLEALRKNFNTDKLQKLEAIRTNGVNYKAKQDEVKADNAAINELIAEAQTLLTEKAASLEALKENVPTPGEVDMSESNELKRAIEILKAKQNIVAPTDSDDLRLAVLKDTRTKVQESIDKITKEYAKFEQLEQIENRISELLAQEKSLASQLASLEKQEFQIDEFNSLKIKSVESKINAMFKFVTFKMFNTLINGGVEECCETLINGVEYSDANTASRINAGLDIISTLSNYYGIKAPCFIDRAESVTKFLQFENQIVKLVVSESDKTLRIA